MKANRTQRCGASTLVLVAFLLIPLTFFVAFALDNFHIVTVRQQLLKAADAGALAGAPETFDRDELTGAPNQIAEIQAARARVKMFVEKNRTDGMNLTIEDEDIDVGYLANPSDRSSQHTYYQSPPRPYSPPQLFSAPNMPGLSLFWLPTIANPRIPYINPPTVSGTYSNYNSIRVRTRRDSVRNGPILSFFGGATGHTKWDIDAYSTATYEDNIRGFSINPNGPTNSLLLPLTMDVNTFAAAAAGLSVLDLYKYDPKATAIPPIPNGPNPQPPNYSARVTMAQPQVTTTLQDPRLDPRVAAFNPTDPTLVSTLLPGDRVREAMLVPLALPAKTLLPVGTVGNLLPAAVSIGNFGTLNIGAASSNDLTKFQRQLLFGPNAADFAAMGGSIMLGSDGTLKMKGDGSVPTVLKSMLLSIRGQPRVIPLYRPDASTLVLSNSTTQRDYTIVGFAGVIVLEVIEIPATPAVTAPLTGTVLVPGQPASLRMFIQPEFVIDPTAIGGGSTLNNGGAKTSRFVYRPLKVTR